MTTTVKIEDLLLEAKQGNVAAQNQLGWSYWKGHGLTPNIERAWYWFNEAAKQGSEEARLNLGQMYREGLVKDFTDDLSRATTKLAKKWFEHRRAALQEGMPLLTIDEINAKVHRLRGGD
jgi:TPR repeat protein